MPVVSPNDQILLFMSNCKAAQLAALHTGPPRYPFPVNSMMRQVVSDRLALAGEHLRAGDQSLLTLQFRSAISRHYYAMYHSARAIVYAVAKGDDHERHSNLPRNLPATMQRQVQRESELTAARLLRNEADYDPYPAGASDWEPDARSLAVTAPEFVQACEDFALANGLI